MSRLSTVMEESLGFPLSKIISKLNNPNTATVLQVTGGVLIVTLVVKKAHEKYKNFQERRYFNILRLKRQQEREQEFTELRKKYPYSQAYKEVTELSLETLQDKLFRRDLTAETVLKAFIAKALEVQDEFNCITEFIPNTLETAKTLDQMHMVKGPLHGIPFCVKDDTRIEGMDSTIGCTRNLYKPSSETAVIVQTLESLGAIPFCRTNLPQTCVSMGSENPIFGKTLNPLNKKLGPGGSSSGSACLVAAGGAPFGTGADSGGSLRIPAHFCGISTIKSTTDRLSRRGCLKCLRSRPSVPGIFAKRAQDVAIVMQAMTENGLQNRLDGRAVPISWNSQIFESKQKLRIGYFTSHDPYPALGDTEKVVLKAKTYLESTGHILIPFELPFDTKTLFSTPFDIYAAEDLNNLLHNDKISISIKDYFDSVINPSAKTKVVSAFRKIFEKRDSSPPKTVESLMEDWSNKLLDEMKKEEIDLILSPAFPFPAIEVDEVSLGFEGATIYTFLWNVLDFPVGVVKVWTETGLNWNPYENDKSTHINTANCSDNWRDVAGKKGMNYKGMPIGVQIIGKPYNEELILKTMVELDEINNPV